MGDPSSKKLALHSRWSLRHRLRGPFLTTSTFNMTSTVNPPPADLSAVVLKMEPDGTVRLRTEDEETVDGNGDIDYTYFIMSCAVGVSAASLLHSLLLAVPCVLTHSICYGAADERQGERDAAQAHQVQLQGLPQCLLGDCEGG